METTEFKTAVTFIIIVLIAIIFELPARIIKRLQRKQIVKVQIDVNKIFDKPVDKDNGYSELMATWTEQDFWYPPEIKPVREGVYRVKWISTIGTPILNFAYWRLGGWGVISHTIDGAAANKHSQNCVIRDFEWRGVTYETEPVVS